MKQVTIKELDKECSLKEAIQWVLNEMNQISGDRGELKVTIAEKGGFCDIEVVVDYD